MSILGESYVLASLVLKASVHEDQTAIRGDLRRHLKGRSLMFVFRWTRIMSCVETGCGFPIWFGIAGLIVGN